jgi:hypothetical protein
MTDRTMKLRSAIGQGQRRPKSNAPGGGGVMRFTATGIEYLDADGNPLPPRKPDPIAVERERLKEVVQAAQAAFEAAVVQDWPSAMDRFLEWCDAMGQVNASAGGIAYPDVPRFAELVERLAYQEAIRRRR